MPSEFTMQQKIKVITKLTESGVSIKSGQEE